MTNFKMLPLAVALTAISAGASAMEELGDDFMSEATGQAGITIETSAIVDVRNVAYKANGGSVTLQDVSLRGTGTGGALEQTIDIDVVSNADMAGNQATAARAARAAGDAIRLNVGNMNVTADIGAVQLAGGSLGRITVEGVALTGTDTYIYALDGEKGIGIDTTVNQSIGRVIYKDVDWTQSTAAIEADINTGQLAVAAVAGSESADTGFGNGTLILNDINISQIDMQGTKIKVLADQSINAGESNAYTADIIEISTPSIGQGATKGSITIGSVQLGSTALLPATAAQYVDESIGGLRVDNLQVAAGTLKIIPFDSGQGISINQNVNIENADITYVSGAIDNSKGSTDFYNKGNDLDADGVGSITAQGLTLEANVIADLTVNSASQLVMGNNLSEASFAIANINVGSHSLGGLSISGLNVQSTATIYAH